MVKYIETYLCVRYEISIDWLKVHHNDKRRERHMPHGDCCTHNEDHKDIQFHIIQFFLLWPDLLTMKQICVISSIQDLFQILPQMMWRLVQELSLDHIHRPFYTEKWPKSFGNGLDFSLLALQWKWWPRLSLNPIVLRQNIVMLAFLCYKSSLNFAKKTATIASFSTNEHHDNSSCHTAHTRKEFLERNNLALFDIIVPATHHTYNPDLNINNFFTFHKIKNRLHGHLVLTSISEWNVSL